LSESESTSETPSAGKAKKAKASAAGSRSLSDRAERSLKDADKLMKKSPDAPAHQKAMAQLEQAKVSALLQLAESIRESRKA
jgi:hypothetical protein